MMRRLADLAVSTTFAGSLLLANTSCATRHPDGAATSAPRSETQVPGVQRLVQFSFGTQAAFGEHHLLQQLVQEEALALGARCGSGAGVQAEGAAQRAHHPVDR